MGVIFGGSCFRNIPAHAGKTFYHPEYQFDTAEHPRACGENLLAKKAYLTSKGTSPRMRGKPP